MNDTRDFIIDEAYKLFLTQSYEAVSISTISDAIGLTKGALYHHFTNKEDLFKAVIDKHFPSFVSSDGRTDITLKELIDVCAKDAENVLRGVCPKDMKFNPISFIGIMSDAFRHYGEFAKSKLSEFDFCINRILIRLTGIGSHKTYPSALQSFYLVKTGNQRLPDCCPNLVII